MKAPQSAAAPLKMAHQFASWWAISDYYLSIACRFRGGVLGYSRPPLCANQRGGVDPGLLAVRRFSDCGPGDDSEVCLKLLPLRGDPFVVFICFACVQNFDLDRHALFIEINRANHLLGLLH